MRYVIFLLLSFLTISASAQITVNTNFLPNTAAPLDLRAKIATLGDTTSIPFPYQGQFVYVTAMDSFIYKNPVKWVTFKPGTAGAPPQTLALLDSINRVFRLEISGGNIVKWKDENSGGTVTNFSAGDMTPLFTTTETNTTTTPALSFSPISQTQKTFFAAPNAANGNPTFRTIIASDVPTLNQNTTGSAGTLTTGRTIGITGDLTYTSPSFNGSSNVTSAGTLATVNANVGTFTNSTVTVNAKGLVTAASSGSAVVGESTTVGDTPTLDLTLTGYNITGRVDTSLIATKHDLTLIVPGTGTVTNFSAGDMTPLFTTTETNTTTTPALSFSPISQTQKTFFAAPNAANGNPTFRTIVASDVPTLNQNTTGSAGTLTTGRTIGITGDLTYTSPTFNGSSNVTAAGTLATVNANVGTFTNSTVTVNAKGLVTAASSGSAVTGESTTVGDTPTIDMTMSGYNITSAIQPASIDSSHIKTSGIGTTDIADGVVKFAKLQNSGVTASTYNNVTVNNKGIVTSGSNVAYLTVEGDADPTNELQSLTLLDSINRIFRLQISSGNTVKWKDENSGGTVTNFSAGDMTPLFTTTETNTTTTPALSFSPISQTQKTFFAAPNAANGNPTFRTIVASDVPTLNQNTTGSAGTLTTGRTIGITGDLTYTSPTFNGSSNVTAAGTLATVNANVGTFTNSTVTVNAKGLVTAASSGSAVTGESTTVGDTPTLDLTLTGYNITGRVDTSLIATKHDLTLINTSTPDSTIVTAGTGISVTESPANTFTVTNTAPDQTVTITGAIGTYPNFTLLDASHTNELQSLSTNGSPGNISISGINTITLNVNDADANFANEGRLGVSAEDANSSRITSNTAGANGVRIDGSNTILVTESTSTNGGGIIFKADTSRLATKHDLTLIVPGTGTVTNFSAGDMTPLFTTTETNTTTTPALSFSPISQTQKTFFAAPNAANGNPTFRTIAASDVPTLNQNTTGSAGTLTTGRTIGITGDLTYTSPSFNGSSNVTAAGTLATVNANVGTFTNSTVTVNAKGLVTAASSGSAVVGESTTVGDTPTLDLTLTGYNITGRVDTSLIATKHDLTLIGGGLGGSGTTNYVSKFNSSSTLTNSQIFDNGTNVGVNDATPSAKLDVQGGSGAFIALFKETGVTEETQASGNAQETVSIQGAGAASLHLRETGSNVDAMYGVNTTNGYIGTATSHPLDFYTSNNQRMTISNGGEVKINNLSGIGTRAVTTSADGTLGASLLGTVSSITATSPLTGGTITTSGSIGIQNATTSQTGALTNADWNTFNSKVGGSGTVNTIPYFSGSNTLSSSQFIRTSSTVMTLSGSKFNQTFPGSSSNLVFGDGGNATQSGTGNVIMGFNSPGGSLTTGFANFLLGAFVGNSLTTGSGNLLFGNGAGRYIEGTTLASIAIGEESLRNASGNYNIGIGPSSSLYSPGNTIGIGRQACQGVVGSLGTYNIGIGEASNFSYTSGSQNVSIGRNVGYAINTGAQNVGIGNFSNRFITSGIGNISIGYQAGYSNSTSHYNIAIGYQAGYNETTGSKLYIANSATNTPLIGGNFANSRLGINKTISSISSTLHVGGDLTIDTRTGTSTTLAGYTSTGTMSTLGLGTGLTISGGNLVSTLTAPETWADISGNVVSWASTGTFGSGKPVGIGVITPSRHLDVNSDVRLRGAIYTSANTSGTAGQSLKSNGSSAFYYEDNCTVQIWTTPGSYTYTKPTNAKSVYVKVIGAGGGGAGGSKSATNTLALGGAGGDGGGYSEFNYRASELTINSTVTVGAGGAGGAGATANSTSGANGGDGGNSQFANIVAEGGRRGDPSLSKFGFGITDNGTFGSRQIDGSTTYIAPDSKVAGGGGGGGGSISTANTLIGVVTSSGTRLFTGGFQSPTFVGGQGTNGGAANLSGNGSAGSAPANTKFGAGGGGGGAARNSVGNGGAGAAGQGGAVMVITYY